LALEHTPLDPAALPEGARKVLTGPAPLKLMAARGLAPLKPVELVAVLYQLALDPDPPLRTAAEKSATDLPEKILGAALADPALDARVLDFFAARVVTKPALVEALLLNRAVADETVLELTPKLGEKHLDLVAVNEQRLLRAPAIIGAMYMNRKARMSTVDRAVELAVRNGLVVPGVPRWDDVVAAVLGDQKKKSPAEVDAAFARVAAATMGDDPQELLAAPLPDDDLEVINAEDGKKLDEQTKELPISELSVSQKIRLATLGNALARGVLIRDTIKMVALAAVNSPGMTDNEIIKYSANRSLADDVIRVIAATKEWHKIYQIKVNLVNNPKTPINASTRLLPFLHERDLKNVARSRAIPSAIVAQAKKLLSQKGR
jgi:hypothetical protein